jgi:hypothetical protein
MTYEGAEPTGADYSAIEQAFLIKIAHASLDATESSDVLKHHSDLWWNLCGWEATRAGVLDGKAQSLLSLASVVGAVVSLSTTLGGDQVVGGLLRATSIVSFILAAAIAVWALRVREHAGFHDGGTFGALCYDGKAVDWFPEFKDKDGYRLYLRELCLQRWAVYRRIKGSSDEKARRVIHAQYAALAGAVLLALSVVVQVISSHTAQASKSTASQGPSVASSAPKPAASGPR